MVNPDFLKGVCVMKKTFKYYRDPGHGWVAVKRKLLSDLGILHKITSFSYQKGKTVYLEEDLDASTFIDAYMVRYGEKPTLVDINQDYANRSDGPTSSPIPHYDWFRLTPEESPHV